MTAWLRTLSSRIRSLFSRRASDDDFARELESHLALLTEENIRRGMSPGEARRAARLRLGGQSQLEQTNRELRGFPLLESFLQDVRYALRMLRKSPGFTLVAILTLALGIGANTAIFSVAYGILLKPLPFQNSSQLVQIWANGMIFLRQPDVDLIETQGRSFEQIAECNEAYKKISGGAPPEMVGTTLVSGNFLTMLGVHPILGRPILPGDTEPGHNQVAVLSYKLWQRRFGGDPSVLGKTVTLDSQDFQKPTKEAFTVIGVLPALYPYPSPGHNELLIPLVPWENNGQVIAIGRLKPGATVTQANAELRIIAASLAAEYPKRDKELNLTAGLLLDRVNVGLSLPLLVLFRTVRFVLLLACVNVSSLLIARTWERQKEVAVREALGATLGRLIQQFLAEGIVLSLLGGSLGLLLARWGLNALIVIAPAGTPRLAELSIDWTVAGYALLVSLLNSIAFALVPALVVSRPGLETALKGGEGGLGGRSSRRSHRLRNLLVALEISLAFLLVVGSTLAIRSFSKLINVNLGFRLDRILTTFVELNPSNASDQTASRAALEEILNRVRSLHGVESASIAEWRPLSSTYVGSVEVPGVGESLQAEFQFASDGYFETLGIPLLAGRTIETSDSKNSSLVAVVNRNMAERYFNGQPLGKRFVFGKDKEGKPVSWQIVGEVGDTRNHRPSSSAKPLFYIPFFQKEALGYRFVTGVLLLRTSVNPLALSDAMREQIHTVDPEALALGTETMGQAMSEQVAEPRFQTQLLGAFGALGLILAVVGVYGVISYTAAQRTREVGIRIALGARPRDILLLLLGEGLAVTLAGLGMGALAAIELTRYMQSVLFEVRPTDPATFLGVSLLLGLVALAACYVPARRASRVDPLVALRYE